MVSKSSSQSRKTPPPARVRIYFFEKKVPAPVETRLVEIEHAATEISTLPTAETVIPAKASLDLRLGGHGGPPQPAESAAPRRKGLGAHHEDELDDPSRRPTVRMQALAEPLAATERRPPAGPSRSSVPRADPQETLEYHRRRLQQLAGRSAGASTSRGNMTLFGHSLFARGRFKEAQVVFETIVSRQPDDPLAYSMLGAIFMALEDDTRALALFDAAVSLQPDELAALVGRAEIRLRRGQPLAALRDLESALDADPDGSDPFSQRARSLSTLARTLSKAAT